MKARPGHIQPRARFFIGCEGESEQSYVQVLQNLCDARGLRVHLAAELLREGDALSRLESAQRNMVRYERRGPYVAKFALLDADQRKLSPGRAAQADNLASQLNITVIWQSPCHEGLLAKHFSGANSHPQTADDALDYLRQFWPEYTKNTIARKLGEKIDTESTARAGAHIAGLGRLLKVIGLTED